VIQVNCFVADCKYQVRYNCQKQIIEVNKVGTCKSFIHDPARFRGGAEAVPALNANEATPLLSEVKV
jgi:hypothetical protein